MTAPAKSRFLRLAGLCGFVAPILSFGLILYAVSISPWFNWQTDALSDLGLYPRASALPFNLALIGGGLLNVTLVLGVSRYLGRHWLGQAGAVVSLVGALALMLIGVLPEDQLGPHWTAAATYFLVTPVGYALIGAHLSRSGRSAYGAAMTVAAMAALAVILWMPHDGLAVPELIAALALSSQTFSIGAKLWLESDSAIL